ncbi:hypothetical protein [Cupriavidus necator]
MLRQIDRDLEPKLAAAQRAGKKERVRALHAKAHRRKDFLQKCSTVAGATALPSSSTTSASRQCEFPTQLWGSSQISRGCTVHQYRAAL